MEMNIVKATVLNELSKSAGAVSFSEIRKLTDASKAGFDLAVIQLAEAGLINLHRNVLGNFWRDEQMNSSEVTDGYSWFIGANLR
jgi:hypothetical protein